MKLVIVESPTKTKTLKKFLDKEFRIAASLGHIRDLPPKKFGVDLKNFEPEYTTIRGKGRVIKELKKLQKQASKTILATDLDREGEAIAWHLAEALDLGEDYQRIVFHEITKSALEKALKNPSKIDLALVNAQQARRILDRIVGYKLSPLLWKKVARGLSAGRVQSVALRLIAEREKEIEEFVPKEYWSVIAQLFKTRGEIFEAGLNKIKGKKLSKFDIKTKQEAKKIVRDLEKARYIVEKVTGTQTKRSSLPPFITNTLQQQGWYSFKLSSKQTIFLAQRLYEQGLITYPRTDSLNLSREATQKAKKIIVDKYGKEYWPGKVRTFKIKSKSAQEAHEAIRPTYPNKMPGQIGLNGREAKLYELIWQRFIASQMSPALFERMSVDIKAGDCTFQAKGQALKFDGFLKVYPIKYKDALLPKMKKGDQLDLKKLDSKQHFTKPPARYNEASLIKELKQSDIGRPSTYAPIISVIQDRNYVEKDEEKRFCPTGLGRTVNDILVKHFPRIVNIKFTAKMEKDLDKVAQGKKEWKKLLKDFYRPFETNLEEKYKEIKKKVEKTDKKCPECGAALVIRIGRFGKFYGCSKFPKCKYTQNLKSEKRGPSIKCPKCGKGKIIQKRTKKGKIFYGCDQWPDCDSAFWDEPLPGQRAGTGEKCPECSSLLVKTKRGQIKCSKKECDYRRK